MYEIYLTILVSALLTKVQGGYERWDKIVRNIHNSIQEIIFVNANLHYYWENKILDNNVELEFFYV